MASYDPEASIQAGKHGTRPQTAPIVGHRWCPRRFFRMANRNECSALCNDLLRGLKPVTLHSMCVLHSSGDQISWWTPNFSAHSRIALSVPKCLLLQYMLFLQNIFSINLSIALNDRLWDNYWKSIILIILQSQPFQIVTVLVKSFFWISDLILLKFSLYLLDSPLPYVHFRW